MNRLHWLSGDSTESFPDLDQALKEPDGLLAIGGDLSPTRLLNAYRHGIFPWYTEGEPILWWSPDPRCVLFPDKIRISRSLKKTLKKQLFQITFDTAFAEVMRACASPRPGQSGTWITPAIYQAYNQMHQLGYAHSVEIWLDGKLVGGLYGMAIGQMFFGESMFSRVTDASKVALVHLCEFLRARDFRLIDSQVHTRHLQSMGAEMMSRAEFARRVAEYTALNDRPGKWKPES